MSAAPKPTITTTPTERRPTDRSTRTTTSDASANSPNTNAWLYPLGEPGNERYNIFSLGGLTIVETDMDIPSFGSMSTQTFLLLLLMCQYAPTDEQPMATLAFAQVLGFVLVVVDVYMDIWSLASMGMALNLQMLALLVVPMDEQRTAASALTFAPAGLMVALWLCRIAWVRTKVRERYGIPGTVTADWHVALLQPKRSLQQMQRHIQRAHELECELELEQQ